MAVAVGVLQVLFRGNVHVYLLHWMELGNWINKRFMGLDISHDTWHGAYSAFMRWRIEIAKHIGIDLESMEGFGGITKWDDFESNPLYHLLNHSDCDGEIDWIYLEAIANELERILPFLPEGDGGGHIGNWKDKTQIIS